MIDPKSLSRSKPEGGPNTWPVADYNALVALVRAAAERDEEHVVDRVVDAGITLGLPPRHWLPQALLTFSYGKFPLYGGRSWAEDADTFLSVAGIEDLRDRETFDWAMTAAGRSQQ